MTAMTLYEISKEYELLLHDIYDEEGNENPQAIEKLEKNELALQEKAIAIASWVKNMEIEKASLAEAKRKVDEYKKDIIDREKSLENKIERMENFLQSNMERRGITEIKCPYFVLKIKKNNHSVDDYDKEKIPNEYWVYTKRLDKIKILQELKNGVVIEGARLQQKTRLEIK